MFLCRICNEKTETKRSLSSHITRKHKELTKKEKLYECCISFYSEDKTKEIIYLYVNEELCADDLKKMGYYKIVEYLIESELKRTQSQEKKTKRYKNKYEQKIKSIYGDNIKNISQIPSVQKKKEKTFSKNYGSYNKYLECARIKMKRGYEIYKNDEEKIKLSNKNRMKTFKEKYNVENAAQLPHVKKIISKKAKERFSNLTYEERLQFTSIAREAVCHRGGYESKIEKRFQHILVENDIDFIKHVHLFNYNYDILIFGNLLIEIQGDMWHAHPSIYKEDDIIMGKLLVKDIWNKDKKKRKKVVDNGYRLIYIWEHEIKTLNDDEILLLVLTRSENDNNRNYKIH